MTIGARLRRGWTTTAVVGLNTLACLAILNGIAAIALRIRDNEKAPVQRMFPEVDLKRVYPGYTQGQIDSLLAEEWKRVHTYEPFTGHREEVRRGRYINISDAGFRLTDSIAAPWPPPAGALNVFVFGGSTTFGVGLADSETIPARLAVALRQRLGAAVHVYNFGRGYYYSSQERALFAVLLESGRVPGLAVFIDGLNDFGNRQIHGEQTWAMP